jgi:hypothetical protein
MAEIVYDSVTCPNPEVVMVEALNAMALATKQAICKSLVDSVIYTDSEVAAINTRLDAIDSQDTLSKIAALKSLVDSLDLDVDGSVVNDLLSIKALAESAQASATNALAKATSASADATKASQDVLAVSQALAGFQTSVNNSIAGLTSRVSTLESSLSTLADTVANLPTGGLTEAQAVALAQAEICKNNVKMANGLSSAVASFIATMEGPCPIAGDDGLVL